MRVKRTRATEDPVAVIRPNEHYFAVRVNELFLTNSREWLRTYDPMVFVLTEFTYGSEHKKVPFLVGPSLLKDLENLPQGMIFRNTRVAGLHPYRGGRFVHTVVLSRIKRGDFARDLLGLVEKVSGSLDFSSALGTYTKLSGVLLDGFEKILGLSDTEPLVGFRGEFDPGFEERFVPGYFALIDAQASDVDHDSLWVVDGALHYGPSEAELVPYRDTDFVLYSIGGTSRRTDDSVLPFYPLFEQVIRSASKPGEDDWKRAKANMLTLYEALILSADLTHGQAEKLADDYVERMKTARNRAETFGRLEVAAGQASVSGVEEKVAKAITILDL
ncbi:MAG: hypothetical protein O7D91_04060 [Planctomycetota bacterium]|nr:hypothetical protein [Planctomycetota bacterium]